MVIPMSSRIWIKFYKDVGISIRDLLILLVGFGVFLPTWHDSPPSNKRRGLLKICKKRHIFVKELDDCFKMGITTQLFVLSKIYWAQNL